MTINLKTPTGSDYIFNIDIQNHEIVCVASKTRQEFRYELRIIRDLYDWLKNTKQGQPVRIGTKNEDETPNAGTVEEWARSTNNPIGGFHGKTNHFRGRVGSFIPPILEWLGLAKVGHNPKNNQMNSL